MKIDKAHRGLIRIVLKIGILVAALYLIFTILLGLVRVEGGSMSGRIEDGDLALYSRMDKQFKADDIAIFEHDGKRYISSIVAMPGDLIEFDEQGCLYVNGVKESEAILYDKDQGERLNISLPYRVPNGSYFMINNNPEALEDSRAFGAISEHEIQGKMIGILRTRAL